MWSPAKCVSNWASGSECVERQQQNVYGVAGEDTRPVF